MLNDLSWAPLAGRTLRTVLSDGDNRQATSSTSV